MLWSFTVSICLHVYDTRDASKHTVYTTILSLLDEQLYVDIAMGFSLQ